MAPAQADKPLCFAIMPITTPDDTVAKYGGDSDHFVHIAEFIFKPAAEMAGYQFVPAAVDSSRVIQAAIIDNLANANVVLCDTSLWNANVFFELGIRVAINKPVALVRDKLTTSVPFDNTPVHCYEYDHRMDPWRTREEIPKLSEHIAAAGKHEQNALWQFAGIQVTAQQSDVGSPEDAKLDLLLAEMTAMRQRTDQIQEAYSALTVPIRPEYHQSDTTNFSPPPGRNMGGFERALRHLLLRSGYAGSSKAIVLKRESDKLNIITPRPLSIDGKWLDDLILVTSHTFPGVRSVCFTTGEGEENVFAVAPIPGPHQSARPTSTANGHLLT